MADPLLDQRGFLLKLSLQCSPTVWRILDLQFNCRQALSLLRLHVLLAVKYSVLTSALNLTCSRTGYRSSSSNLGDFQHPVHMAASCFHKGEILAGATVCQDQRLP